MKHLYCVSVPVADLRAAPDPASELLTQAVLATPARKLESQGPWVLVDLPDYRGWLRRAEIVPANASDVTSSVLVTAPRTEGLLGSSESTMSIYAGTMLVERARTPDAVVVELPGRRTARLPLGSIGRWRDLPATREAKIEWMLAFVRLFLDAPYLWGGWTVGGIDCSGLVQLAGRIVGYRLPRDAHQQHAALDGEVPADGLEPGDLVFFHETNCISHVGIFAGDGRYIHASMPARRVLVSDLFEPASEIDRSYAAKLAGAKRVIRDE